MTADRYFMFEISAAFNLKNLSKRVKYAKALKTPKSIENPNKTMHIPPALASPFSSRDHFWQPILAHDRCSAASLLFSSRLVVSLSPLLLAPSSLSLLPHPLSPILSQPLYLPYSRLAVSLSSSTFPLISKSPSPSSLPPPSFLSLYLLLLSPYSLTVSFLL